MKKVTTFVSIITLTLLFNGCNIPQEGFINSTPEVYSFVETPKYYSKRVSYPMKRFKFETQVLSSEDDAKENSEGRVNIKSSTLEMTQDGEESQQIIGIRFANVKIPRKANIIKAYIKFTAKARSTDVADLIIQTENSTNPKKFKEEYFNITDRRLSRKSINWNPALWDFKGESKENETTNDLSELVQDIVNKRGWRSGNAIVFIITGEGNKVASSFDADKNSAPKLYIEYEAPAKKKIILNN
jgi:hypothetical protein